jgi:hypothetical protein
VAALSTSLRLVAQGKGRAAAKKGDEDEEISLAEDLMREHAVLKRVLLIYREIMKSDPIRKGPGLGILCAS